MNLSKTALRELSAKYRAVLIKCALMNMMIFAGARVAAKNLNTATAVIGTKASKTFTAGKHAITPEVRLALTYDFARPKEDRTVTLPDGSSYVAAGEHLKRLGMEIGAKAAVRLTNEVDLSVSYDGAFKKDYQDHTGMLNLKLMFQ